MVGLTFPTSETFFFFENHERSISMGMNEAEERRKFASAVMKLDETVGVFGRESWPLLSEEESRTSCA